MKNILIKKSPVFCYLVSLILQKINKSLQIEANLLGDFWNSTPPLNKRSRKSFINLELVLS
ncbi:MAG: hypothetical protein BGO14_03560 [Chlamydiales bacterium 38-26]|nr:MAG: hypothetical protein BGO14_03560 [Chlamydiales bacterium 38-26]